MDREVDAIVEALRNVHGIPGVSLAVVSPQRGYVATKGYGVSNLSTQVPVTPQTAFGVGSISKGFTSALLATVLQESRTPKVTWDTPLVEIMGENLKFGDQFRTEKACLRDLLAHKMGIELGETDFGWMCGGVKRNELLRLLEHCPLKCDFRTSMMYNNFMYVVAAQVAEHLTGQTWEKLVDERFFQLLGMENATFMDRDCANLAQPYMAVNGKCAEVPLQVHRCSETIGPAGSVACSADDMAKWMNFLLQKGSIDGIPIIEPRFFEEMWKPQFALPRGKPEWDGYASMPTFPVTETRDAYCFGWYSGTYRGYRMIAHSGELFGYDGLLTLSPDMSLGIYSCFNGPGGEAAFIGNQLLHYYISDCMLNLDKWLDVKTVQSFPEPWKPRKDYFIPRAQSDIKTNIPATRPLLDYAGTFRNGFLGEISINVDIESERLCMFYGDIGRFHLHPDGEEDEFRIEGRGAMSFLHQLDLYSPTDWMMVKFTSSPNNQVDGFICSLFESQPVFKKL